MFVLLTLFLVAASANVQQFMNQEEAMAMMAQPYDDFVSKVMAQIRTAMAQAHEAYAPTSDTEGEVTELHLAVAKPFSPTEESSESEKEKRKFPFFPHNKTS
jgi:hypothetical protein